MPAVSITGKQTLGDLVKNGCLRPAAAALVKPLWRWVPRSAYLGKSPMHLGLAITRKCNAKLVFSVHINLRVQKTRYICRTQSSIWR